MLFDDLDQLHVNVFTTFHVHDAAFAIQEVADDRLSRFICGAENLFGRREDFSWGGHVRLGGEQVVVFAKWSERLQGGVAIQGCLAEFCDSP